MLCSASNLSACTSECCRFTELWRAGTTSGCRVRCDEQRWPNLNPDNCAFYVPSLFWPYLFFLGNLRDFKWRYYKITLLRVLLKVRFTISCSVPAIEGFFPLSCHLQAVSIICKRKVSGRCELPFLSRCSLRATQPVSAALNCRIEGCLDTRKWNSTFYFYLNHKRFIYFFS